jgi:hypothetical protein
VVQVHGLGERHWELLGLLAEHGALHTGQVTTLLFGSRPAAVRHLAALTRAGLVWRFVHDNDPTHLAYYQASTDGILALQERLARAGRAAPPALGATGWDMFVLTSHSNEKRRGRLHLMRDRSASLDP